MYKQKFNYKIKSAIFFIAAYFFLVCNIGLLDRFLQAAPEKHFFVAEYKRVIDAIASMVSRLFEATSVSRLSVVIAPFCFGMSGSLLLFLLRDFFLRIIGENRA